MRRRDDKEGSSDGTAETYTCRKKQRESERYIMNSSCWTP